VDDAPHPQRLGGGQDDARALDVRSVDLGRIAGVEAVVGGAMKDLVAARDPLPDRDGVGHVAGDALHRQRVQQRGVARGPHQAAHAPPAPEQRARHLGADEAGRARHEGRHDATSTRRS
jgi:hypothetical protein